MRCCFIYDGWIVHVFTGEFGQGELGVEGEGDGEEEADPVNHEIGGGGRG